MYADNVRDKSLFDRFEYCSCSDSEKRAGILRMAKPEELIFTLQRKKTALCFFSFKQRQVAGKMLMSIFYKRGFGDLL